MMMKFLNKTMTLVLLISVGITSCTSDDREPEGFQTPPAGTYADGIFILNEGGFGSSNASVSYIDNNDQIFNGIYTAETGMNLGDVAQSMAFNDELAYIVVNNSSTIEIVNRFTFEHMETVTNLLLNPRYITFSGNKGYISDWGDPNNIEDDFIAVLNLQTNIIEATIAVPEGPEQLLAANGNLYIAHTGGYGYGNTISVINTNTQIITNTITVADVPNGMVIENQSLYVMCSGKAPFTGEETTAALFKINLNTNAVENSQQFPEGEHPKFLQLANNELYYTKSTSVYTTSTNTLQISQSSLLDISEDGGSILYGFAVNNDKIYIADAKDYASNGEALIYSLTGNFQQSFTTEIIPNSFYFNN